jgi:excisionase family DNA binding protein
VKEADAIERIAYRPAEAARAIGVHRNTIYRLMESGELPSFAVGHVRLIRADDLRAMIDNGRRGL